MSTSTAHGSLAFVDLPSGHPVWALALPVLIELRPRLTATALGAVLIGDDDQGARFFAAMSDGDCLGVAGYRILRNTSAGRKLYVDDLVTTAGGRSRGIGGAMLSELIERARSASCGLIELDSGLQRADAHRFYLRERMAITAFHFSSKVAGPVTPHVQGPTPPQE